MMPPKKSKAARSDNLDSSVAEKEREPVVHTEDEEPEKKKEDHDDVDRDDAPEEKQKKEPFNMFNVTMVEGKRKRVTSSAEDLMNEWVHEHLEDKEERKLPLGDVYSLYLEKCASQGKNAIESNKFYHAVWKVFPKGFGFKGTSPHVDTLKEKSMKKKEPKVKAATLAISIRTIIEDSLTEMGNPRAGVRFNMLLKFIAGKYPALQIEQRPKTLLTALNRGVYYGYLTNTRGVGKCGFYRKFIEDEPSEDEEEDVKKEKKTGGKKEKKGDEEEGEEESKEDKDGEDAKEGEGEKDGEESKDEKKEGEEEEEEEEEEEKKKKKPKKKAKRPAKPKVVHHAEPNVLEDTFYLAMTFGSEPKEASVTRIRKYIEENYPDIKIERLGKCLDDGKEKGYWDQVTGSSGNYGTFRLEVDSFDPTDDDDMTGKVVNAIMACTEPKMCSAILLKKFVLDWYPEKFKVAERPHLFKKALERAVLNGQLKQLSGIGASGTFQLMQPFVPSPVILAGQDTLSDYEPDVPEESSEDDAGLNYDYTGYGDKYVPRPSKRRGKARSQAVKAKPAVEITDELTKKKRKRKVTRMTVGKSRQLDSSTEEEESSEEEEEQQSSEEERPAKRGRSPPKKAPARGKKATPERRGRPTGKRQIYADSDSDEPAEHRGRPRKDGKKTTRTEKKKAESELHARKRPSYREDTDSDTDVVDGYHPTPSKSRGGNSARRTPSPKKTPARKSSAKKAKKSPEPKVQTPAAKKQGSRRHVESDSEAEKSSGEEKEEKVNTSRVRTPAAKKQGTRPAPKTRGRRK